MKIISTNANLVTALSELITTELVKSRGVPTDSLMLHVYRLPRQPFLWCFVIEDRSQSSNEGCMVYHNVVPYDADGALIRNRFDAALADGRLTSQLELMDICVKDYAPMG